MAGVLLASLAILTPWFDIGFIASGTPTPLREHYLSERVDIAPDGRALATPYDSTACGCVRAGSAFLVTQMLIWGGALVGAAAYWGRESGRLKRTQSRGLTAIAGLLMVAAPALLALNLPPALQADGLRFPDRFPTTFFGYPPTGLWGASFLGSFTVDPTHYLAWGPGLGWILALLAGGLSLASLFYERPKPLRAMPGPATAPWPAPTPAPVPPVSPQGNGGGAPGPTSAPARRSADTPRAEGAP